MFETDWRKLVTDPQEMRIFQALEDERWHWRTIGALAKASGMQHEEVRRVLEKYPTLVRKSLVPSQSGEELYTLQQRYFERQKPLEKFWNFLSSSSSSSST